MMMSFDSPPDMSETTSTAPAGWYADPVNPQRSRYWDGSRWTDHLHQPDGGGRSSFQSLVDSPLRLVAACGGMGVAVSPLLPWVSVVLVGNLNLFQLLELGGNRPTMAWIAIGVGGGAALTAYAASTAGMVRLATIGLGLLTGGFAVLVLSEMVKDAEDAAGLVRVTWGPWIAVAGCVAMVVAGCLPERKRPNRPSG